MAARGASARTDRLAPQTTREPMRRMSLCVVVSSPPDDLRCYRQIGGKGRLVVLETTRSIKYLN